MGVQVRKCKEQRCIEGLINKMFKIGGWPIDYDRLVRKVQMKQPEWYREYTLTEKEAKKFEKWALPFIQKTLRVSKKRAAIEYQYFNLCYGLRVIPKANVYSGKDLVNHALKGIGGR